MCIKCIHHYHLSHKTRIYYTIYTFFDVQINLIYRSMYPLLWLDHMIDSYSKFHRLKWWSFSWSHSNFANCLLFMQCAHFDCRCYYYTCSIPSSSWSIFFLFISVFVEKLCAPNFFIIRFMLQSYTRVLVRSIFFVRLH